MNLEYRYDPSVFDEPDETRARIIVLTPEAGLTTEERWQKETDFLAPIMGDLAGPVLDIGCGAGRMAAMMVNRYHRKVVGVDTSATMRAHARRYVARVAGDQGEFDAVDWDRLDDVYPDGYFASAMAVWVLQHVRAEDLALMIALVKRKLRPFSRLISVNRDHRCVPVSATNEGGETLTNWALDDFNLENAMLRHFFKSDQMAMPESLCQQGAFITVWVRKP